MGPRANHLAGAPPEPSELGNDRAGPQPRSGPVPARAVGDKGWGGWAGSRCTTAKGSGGAGCSAMGERGGREADAPRRRALAALLFTDKGLARADGKPEHNGDEQW